MHHCRKDRKNQVFPLTKTFCCDSLSPSAGAHRAAEILSQEGYSKLLTMMKAGGRMPKRCPSLRVRGDFNRRTDCGGACHCAHATHVWPLR